MNAQRSMQVIFHQDIEKVKVHPRTGHGGPEREQRYSSTLSLTSVLDGVGGQRHAPAVLPLGKRPSTHCIGGRVGSRAGLEGCGKSRLHRDSSSTQPVAIPAHLKTPFPLTILTPPPTPDVLQVLCASDSFLRYVNR